MTDAPQRIYVVAGVNGAGKSSIVGAALEEVGIPYFNPDVATRQLLEADPALDLDAANEEAWLEMVRLLDAAIQAGGTFAFETTLGGRTITGLLSTAAREGRDVVMWYVGLSSASQHIARVQARVARGGHSIPDDRIRARYESSREHLIELLPLLKEVRVYDNSAETGVPDGQPPQAVLILHMLDGRIIDACPLPEIPEWAKPVVWAALQISTED